jgi:hypothetical protein
MRGARGSRAAWHAGRRESGVADGKGDADRDRVAAGEPAPITTPDARKTKNAGTDRPTAGSMKTGVGVMKGGAREVTCHGRPGIKGPVAASGRT